MAGFCRLSLLLYNYGLVIYPCTFCYTRQLRSFYTVFVSCSYIYVYCFSLFGVYKLDVHESVRRDTIIKVTNKMQLYRLIYYSQSAPHVPGDFFAHHQEHLTVFTLYGIIHGRPKNRWEDNIRNDTKKLKIKNWTSCIQDRNKWKLYVEKAKTFKD